MFIPEKPETFISQFEAAEKQLPRDEHVQLSAAVRFIAFSFGVSFAQDPEQFREHFPGADSADPNVLSAYFLYLYAKNQGNAMTLRKYVDYAETIKRRSPEVWRVYLREYPERMK